ncbi:MAG: DMT family transporter [Burkholderiales bacterium]
MLHADSARNRLTGIGIISLTYVMFTLLDGSAKWLVQSTPVIIVVWLRFLTQALLAAALLFPIRGRALVRTRHLRWHVVRGLMFCVMTGMNFWALQFLQLTVTASIFFTVPILIAVMSAPLLGERMDARRWAAILIGFAGVLVIVRPGSAAFHPAMLLSLFNAVLYAAFNLMTRKLAAYDPPETIQFLPAVVASVVLAPFALVAWQSPPGAFEGLLLCLMGVFGGTGHYLLALAHRYAPASTLAPFLYQQILYMALFGYLVFGSVPDAAVWIGAAIVVSSGLYLFQRERRGR